jgi:purine-binding chemotaxis protein CheW
MSRPVHLVLARVHGLLLGFDVAEVREVLGDDTVLPVPLTPPMVRGLINLRGEVVTVIEARALLRQPQRAVGERCTQIVVQHRRELLSLEVDEVLEVASIAPRQYASRPDGMQDAVRKLASAVVQREKDLVIVVDVALLFEHLAARADERREDERARDRHG